MKSVLTIFFLVFSASTMSACPAPHDCPSGGGGSKVVCSSVTHDFEVNKLPFTHEDNGAGCGHVSVTSSVLPTTFYGVMVNEMKQVISHSFISCVTTSCL